MKISKILKSIFNFFEKRAWLCWSLTAIYMALIFYLSSISYFPPGPITINISDKIKHVFLYMGLGILFFLSLKSIKIKNTPLLAILFTTLYGISDEIHQSFVPNRVCALDDAIANAIGAIIGVLIIWLIRHLVRNGFKGKKP